MASTTAQITAWAARGKLNLKRADGLADGEDAPTPGREPPRLTVADLYTRSRKPEASNEKELFSCEATELPRAAPELLPFRDLGQYGRDVRSGNVGNLAFLRALLVGLFNRLQSLSTRVLRGRRAPLPRLPSAPGPGKRGQAGDGRELSRSGRRCD